MTEKTERSFIIIGAGPAGLTAAYDLTNYHYKPVVLEQGNKVGGIARTENYKGYYFDMGGHRFFTKSEAVNNMWQNVLGEDFLKRPRLSRIYYQKKFFHYPIKLMNALLGLGIIQAFLILFSYIRWQLFPYKVEETFEQWVTNRFGKRLFEIFFKTYTEKIWGIPCSELKAEWAAQRIKDLSLKSAVLSALFKPKENITTLIEEFHYPRFGPGMLWEKVREVIVSREGEVRMESEVIKICRTDNCIDSVIIQSNGVEETLTATDFISSMPIVDFIQKLDPVPEEILASSKNLKYRDFLTVCLIIKNPDLFPDNWIYIHEPDVKVGRIQNFKNWSPAMVPDPSMSSLGMEYFCNNGDEFWNRADTELVEFARKEIAQIGLAKYEEVVDGCVFRVPYAYPVYDGSYRTYLELVRSFVDTLENFQTIGRNGLHRYNNQDHSMITGMLAVRNLLFGEKNNLWSINADREYHEEIRTDEKLDVSGMLSGQMARVFLYLDPVAVGASLGTISGISLFLGTLFLIIKGGAVIGPNLQLLSQIFPGYAVSLPGSFIGLVYAFLTGFILGWGAAYLRNLAVYLNARLIHRDIEKHLLERFLDTM